METGSLTKFLVFPGSRQAEKHCENVVAFGMSIYGHESKELQGGKKVENERKNKLTELLPLSDYSWVLGKALQWYFIPASPC